MPTLARIPESSDQEISVTEIQLISPERRYGVWDGSRRRNRPRVDSEGEMKGHKDADAADAGTPVSVEAAFRRVRLLVGALVLGRLWTAGSISHVAAVLLVVGFLSVNLVAFVAERHDARTRLLLGILQMLADTLVVLLVVWAQHSRSGAESADWAVLVLPTIEGAIRFRVAGAVGSWLVLAGGYWGSNMITSPSLPGATIAQRLTVALLVALPVGYLADQLVAEINANRRGRAQAEQRSILLRSAALGGRRTSRLDVDEIVAVICETIEEMGFVEPQLFELDPDLPHARPIRGSQPDPAIAPDDDRLRAAADVRSSEKTVIRPRSGATTGSTGSTGSTLIACAIPMIDEQFVVLTASWPDASPPSEAPVESLELFAAQAGASLHNAQQHRGLEELKDRLDHAASHDSLTSLANRRRFTEELERTSGRGRPGFLIGVLFLDLDGFKDVNDRYGHDAGNDLLIAVAERLLACVRPGDLVARLGGDEFTVMLTRLENTAPAAAVAERICANLAEPFLLGSREVHISTSIGVALAPADSADTGSLLRRADAAMYRAKSNGKAQWMIDAESLQSVGDSERRGRKKP